MAATINADDLPPEMRTELKIRKPRETQFSKEELRGWSLRVLSLMSSLTRAERQRVLDHAKKVNRV